MKKKRKIIINKTDLDHILDLNLLEENKDRPPSEIFIEGLKSEMELSGYDDIEGLDSIEIIL